MKNGIKFIGVTALLVVIGFSFITCGGNDDDDSIIVENTNGRLTITGIPEEYNGKWINAECFNEDETIYLYAGADAYVGEQLYIETKFALISNGTATLKVWKGVEISEGDYSGYNYTGNDTVLFIVGILECEDFTNIALDEDLMDYIVAEGLFEVTFSNGIGSRKFELWERNED